MPGGPTNLTSEAKQLLATTIRGLRTRLLRDLGDEAERRYRLSVPIDKAGLDEAHHRRRERLEAWLDERVRAGGAVQSTGKVAEKTTASRAKGTDKVQAAARERFLHQAVKEAAATLLNRLVLLRHLEALGLSRPPVVTGGWNSGGYREFCAFAPALTGDETEGYATLLQIVFDELAVELPGLFGDVGLTRLFPVPPATLRELVSRLDDERLASAWTDDTTLGWVYQYWNDPEREALDAKIADGGKIQPHEIASKTQMFTERYMVEWLLQNSLGLTWLCICRRNNWIPDAAHVLPILEARRVAWRAKREANEVPPDALMPIEGDLEQSWKYYVPQPLPDDPAVSGPLAPRKRGEGEGEGPVTSIHNLRLLDPACGSGHFLTAAFDLLVPLYREEARHRGQTITDAAIAESILTRNLHGVDIDPRAVQLAAAGLHLKAKTLAPNSRISHVNLVAPALQLGNLPDDDPALVELRRDLKDEAGIPEDLTRRLVSSLAGVDHLGTLLKVDAAVEDALHATDLEFERTHGQGDLFGGFPQQQVKLTVGEAKATVLDKLEQFLGRHSSSEDLGLRLDGEQLAAGVRFVRMVHEGTYDIVVGNPPYQGTGKLADSSYYVSKYPEAKQDLFAGFFVSALELVRPGGRAAFITLSNWMFLSVFSEFRRTIRGQTLAVLADLGKSAFTTGGTLISTTCAVVERSTGQRMAVAIRPHGPDEIVRDDGQPSRTQAALLLHRGRHEFDPRAFEVIEGEPIVYWWTKEFLARYAAAPKLGQVADVRQGLSTADNARFIRRPWEIYSSDLSRFRTERVGDPTWVPHVMGASGRAWVEGLADVVLWKSEGLEIKEFRQAVVRNPTFHFRRGIAFSMIGNSFVARRHRFLSICNQKGSSVYCRETSVVDDDQLLCSMNTEQARFQLESLNPGVGFEVGDVLRLGLFPVSSSRAIAERADLASGEHEKSTEPSIEFRSPRPSPWTYAQSWAQRAVDRSDGDPLPPYKPTYDAPEPAAFVSFAVGVALGRFGAADEGILDAAPRTALPSGILLVAEGRDSLDHPACAPLHAAWAEHGAAVGEGDDLRTYLRTGFFDWHKRLYENRPIYFPLSSAKKSYVAFVSIHRWRDDTLQTLLADHLLPEKRRLDGELEDIRKARTEATGRGKAEKRFAEVGKLQEELSAFIDRVTALATYGPPHPDDKTPRREVDAPFVMDLDDGVMVNSAALWPLLEPQWKDPKKWWRELASAQGRKDYDWSHLAARYFPTRVHAKCVQDPSLAVAHKCFWLLHPAKAYAWELRLQDEIRPDFTIDEPASNASRTAFLESHPTEARDLQSKGAQRRARRSAKQAAPTDDDPDATPLLDRLPPDDPDEIDA
jgi:hypothetical protein